QSKWCDGRNLKSCLIDLGIRLMFGCNLRIDNVRAAVGLGILVLVFARPMQADDKPPADKGQPMSFWMTKKLEYSQNILAGLATGDFDKIVANAQSMRNLSKIEGFVRGQTPGYRSQLHLFEESTDEIIRQAKKDNVEGATLAFAQLTFSCVNC